MKEILRTKNSMTILAMLLLLRYQIYLLVDESGTIRTQMGKQNRSEMVAVLGTPHAIAPRRSNSNSS
jgi:hypothetical protein